MLHKNLLIFTALLHEWIKKVGQNRKLGFSKHKLKYDLAHVKGTTHQRKEGERAV